MHLFAKHLRIQERLAWICLVVFVVSAIPTSASQWQINPQQLSRLREALRKLDGRYDPREQMLREPFHSPGYHTTLKGGFVHSTRSSLEYAVGLLDTGEDSLLPRAEAILKRVISLQDKNPESKTYGIWPWFLEEPLEKMSPPDWNWADFCGTLLLQVALDHRDRLSPTVAKMVDESIQHAARSIQRRNVGPDYTNIAIMGSYVTLVAAELYGLKDIGAYAQERWRRFYLHATSRGAFTEYNSPTYTVVALREVGRMLKHLKDAQARQQAEAVYRLAWEEIAHHFHPPTRQWAGPHSRSYSTMVGPSFWLLLYQATDGRVNFGHNEPRLDEVRLPLPCPPDLEHYFTELTNARQLLKTFVPGQPPVVGTTYLHPLYALGSVNRGDLWNQRRPLVAYWGSSNSVSSVRLRCLHDGYDFAATQFFSVQRDGAVLAAVNWATDGGDRHVSLDRIKNATFRAKDIRLRFEFEGVYGRRKFRAPNALDEPVEINVDGGLNIFLSTPYARWGNETGHWESGSDGARSWLDVVLYSGPEREINLKELEEAAAGCAVLFATGNKRFEKVDSKTENARLSLKWCGMELSIPIKPAPITVQQKGFTGRANN